MNDIFEKVNSDTIEKQSISNEQPTTITFELFSKQHPQYLQDLNNYIKLLYNTYIMIHRKRYFKLKNSKDEYPLAQRIGYGMLLRHALETMVTCITTESGVDVAGKSVYERLEALRGQNIKGCDNKTKAALSKLLEFTNDIAHPHIIKNPTSFKELHDFFEKTFKNVLKAYIEHMQKNNKDDLWKYSGDARRAAKSRKQAQRYLSALYQELVSFRISNRITSILMRGCLVRQLTECTANLWCYNYSILPTDISSRENPNSLVTVLNKLSSSIQDNRRGAFGVSSLNADVISHLHELRSASNSLMHVEKFASADLVLLGDHLAEKHDLIETECSPYSMSVKLNKAENISKPVERKPKQKSAAIAALLCGFFGWFGLHYFYAGRIIRGLFNFLFLGLIVGPAMDLNKIKKGKFKDAKNNPLKSTPVASAIATLLLLTHLVILGTLGYQLYQSDIIRKIKERDIFSFVTMQTCEAEALAGYGIATDISVLASTELTTESTTYAASYCIDGNGATCWQEGVEGNGIGEKLTFTLNTPQKITAISILNGKHESEKAYTDNARAAKLLVLIGYRPYLIFLEDSRKPLNFILDTPIETQNISIIIVSAYSGDIWEDLCISEIAFYTEPSNP